MENKFKRFLVLLVTVVLLVPVLCTVAFAAEPNELGCYTHGDVNGDGIISQLDAIHTLYCFLFGEEDYAIDQEWDFNKDDCLDSRDAIYVLYAFLFPEDEEYKLDGTIHQYYDPTWKWDTTDPTALTAEISFKCGCGAAHTINGENGVTITTGTVTEATCIAAGSAEYVAKITYDGTEYTNTYIVNTPALGDSHEFDRNQDCENGSVCQVCGYELSALGHIMKENTDRSTDATCNSYAVQVYECQRENCEAEKAVTLQDAGYAAHAYKYVENGDLHEDGTCAYTKVYRCEDCSAETQGETYYIHTYTAKLTKEATCSVEGEKTYTCGTCEDSYTETVAKNDSHAWDDGVTADGITTYTCACGATKTAVCVEANEATVDHADLANSELQLNNDTSLELDSAILGSLEAEKQIVISVDSYDKDSVVADAATLAQIATDKVYDFVMTYSDGTAVPTDENGNFAGTVTVSLPYTLQEGDDVDNINVWYIDDITGELTPIKGTYSNGYVTFTTSHFSYYTVTRLTPAQRCSLYGCVLTEKVQAATCTAEGRYTKFCQRCGTVELDKSEPALGHNYQDTENNVDPTCTDAGYAEQKCANCEHVVGGELPALGHYLLLDETKSTAATCDTAGTNVSVCSTCNLESTETTEKLGHSYAVTETVEATCTTKGYEKYVCATCGGEYTTNEQAPLGHDYAVSSWTWDDTHTGATVVLVCAHDESHTKTLNAVISQKTESATCLEGGSVTYKATASFNNVSYTDSVTVDTEALGHTPGTQWNNSEYQHYRTCTACGEKVAPATHTWGEGTVTKAPTCEASGTENVACTICDYETEKTLPATGVHNYVDGICSVCGNDENACRHLRTYKTPVDTSAYDICGDVEIWYNVCDCGEVKYLQWEGLECTWGDPTTRTETLADGSTYEVYVSTCTVCGLTVEEAWYGEIDTEACYRYYSMYYQFSMNGTVIAESCYTDKLNGWEHPVVVEHEAVNLSDYGLCGDVIETMTCPCGEESHIDISTVACNWVADEANSGETTIDYYSCETCGGKKVIEYKETFNEATCEVSYIETYTYYLNDEQVYTCSYVDGWYNHTYVTTSYEMDGTSCEDGVLVNVACETCGKTGGYYITGHEAIVEESVIDLSDYDICAAELVQYACACDEKHMYHNLNYSEDTYCSWTRTSYDNATGNYTEVCENCGATRTVTMTYGEKDAECRCLRTSTFTYTDKNGNPIATVYDRWDDIRHNMTQTATLAGETCVDGVTITNYCADCGGAKHTNEYTEHVGIVVETYDASDLGGCSSTIRRYECPCGEEGWTYLIGCSFDWVEGGENYHITQCNTCGVTKTTAWEDGEQIDACHIQRTFTDTFTAEGKDPVVITYEATSAIHERTVYELTLVDSAAGCDGGYMVKEKCLTCGYVSSEWGPNYGHGGWELEREIVSEGELCGTLELVTIGCACGEEIWYSTRWTSGECDFQWSGYSEEYGTDIYTCTVCGAFRTSEHTETPVEGTTCQIEYINSTTYFDKDGNELFDYETRGTGTNHNDLYSFTMQGTTCEDGYYLTRTCQDCGECETETYIRYDCNNYRVAEEILHDGTGICGELKLIQRATPCGDSISWYEENSCQFEHVGYDSIKGGSIYKCTVCGLQKFESYNSERVPGDCTVTITRIYTYTLNDEDIASSEKTYSSKEHETVATLSLVGTTCDEGYYISESCIYCDYTRSDDGMHMGHGIWRTEYYDLTEYGMCGGTIEHHSCACGEYSDWNRNNNCNYVYTGNTDAETGLRERYCSDCGMYFVTGNVGENNPDTCMYEGNFHFKAYTADEVKLNVISAVQWESHDFKASFVLDNPEGTCEDGYTVTQTCVNCGVSESHWENGHSTYNVDTLDLAEYGACGGYIYSGACPCGEETYVSHEYTCENFEWGVDHWEEEAADGTIHSFQKNACADCGLTMVNEYYNEIAEGACQGVQYHTYTYTLGTVLNKSFQQQSTYNDHDFTYSYVLAEGSASCEDGVVVTGTCTRCGYVTTHNSYSHSMNKMESIDLTAYGSVCGASLNKYLCACGQYGRYDFNEDTLCDLDRKYVENWIEGSLYDEQPTTEWWQGSYSHSYTYICAVTDPTACGLKIRMSEYWLKEGCEAVEYQTWQLGYDETTGTCQTEFTVATGDRHAYHNYTQTEINQTLEDGTTVTGTDYTCPDCNSYYVEKSYYLNDEEIKYTVDAVNTLDNGERKQIDELLEYGLEANGYRYVTLNRTEYINPNGTVYWYQSTYTYDFSDGCKRTRTSTNSNGHTEIYEDDAHLENWSYETTKEPTCTQFGVEVETVACLVCDQVINQYPHDVDPTAHNWNWDDTLQTYVCMYCGLENVNGASGSIVMEDISEAYSGGTAYAVGYWNRGEVEFNPYVSVILEDSTDENDEIVLTGITLEYLTADKDGYVGLCFDKATTDAAAAAAVAEAGYTGSYAIRISFVPVNSTDTLDYAITFDSVTTE